ncbi:MAG: CPBP family intramembrane metalloprotease [Chloroflexi bacterium]|nr:CPBP family intramembrane metalloprotease [Chloroflexota bacterium]
MARSAAAGQDSLSLGSHVLDTTPFSRLRTWIDVHPTFYPWCYLVWIAAAESMITFGSPWVGLFMHCVLLLVLPAHAMIAENKPYRALLSCLITAPLIRVMSLVLPLIDFPLIMWYFIVSLPVFVSSFFIIRLNNWSWNDIGLIPRHLLIQLFIALGGIAVGFGESRVLPVAQLAPALTFHDVIGPFLILLVSTGFMEELIFRGLLQRASFRLFPDDGILYNSLVFASLHIGYKDLKDLIYVFVIGLLFAIIVRRTGTIIGTTFCHGIANTTLYIFVPLLAHRA